MATSSDFDALSRSRCAIADIADFDCALGETLSLAASGDHGPSISVEEVGPFGRLARFSRASNPLTERDIETGERRV